MPSEGIWTLSGGLWRASTDRSAGEQLDYTRALGKVTCEGWSGGGEITGHLGVCITAVSTGPRAGSGVERKLQETF